MKFYLALFAISLLGTYLARIIALRKKIIDVPNERSSHKKPTPRGGGIAVVGTWYAAITYEFLFYPQNIPADLYYALVSGLALVLVGLIDDLIDISPKIRLVVQVLSSVAALYFLGGLQKIDLGFYIVESPILLSIPAAIFIIWFINLFNFMDGIDGYIATEVIFISVAGGLLAFNNIPWGLATCVLGFLVLNWQPAKIFMGDVGSTLLGFNMAVLAIHFQNVDRGSIIAWVMLSSVFWFDATLTVIRRFRNGENLMKAHKKHAYQRIVQAGFSHQKTTLFALVINCFIGCLVYISVLAHEYLLVLFAVNLGALYVINKIVDKKMPFKKVE